jgi:hypothetical protein
MIHWFLIASFITGNNQVDSSDILQINAPVAVVYAGKSSAISIEIKVKQGYHIQANKVKDEFLIPTTVQVKSEEKIIIENQIFPPTQEFKLEGTDEFLDVYDGAFKINIPFRTKKEVQKGKYMLPAKLHYQACDSKTCLSPKTVDFIIQVEVI